MYCQVLKKSEYQPHELKYQAGDFILTHGTSFFDRLIQLFTMSHWNHTALIVDTEGSIVELVEEGVKKHQISKYDKQEVFIVKTDFGEQDRKEIISYSDFMLKKHPKYGFLQIVSITFKIMTKSRLIIKLDGTQICSEFVANALARGGVNWDKDASLISPADLYNKFVKKGERDLI
jgi:uncharacterized protein YycO